MTNGEKVQIVQMRKRGLGYAEIALSLGLSVNTVKSYCRRSGVKPLEKKTAQSGDVCRQCGSVLKLTPGRKRKQFCSDACRLAWKNKHPKPENWKSTRTAVCPVCGKEFLASREYKSKRKYCSHACANRGRAVKEGGTE